MRLKGVHSVRARGRVYHYAWRGGPRIDAEYGTPEFVAALAQAQASRVAGDGKTIAGLCATFRASRAWASLADKTRRNWSPWLDRIQEEFGCIQVRQFDEAPAVVRIRRWRDKYADTPRTADVALEVMSRLMSFAGEEGQLTTNPCQRIKRLYSANRADKIWTAPDLAELEGRASAEVFRAARLAALTGLRQGDLLRLAWSHVKANSIELPTGKSRHRKVTLIPIYAELRAYLATLPRKKGVTTVLMNSRSLPWRTGFGASWNAAKGADQLKGVAAIPLHFHDLRGTAATRFWLAGLSEREIAEIMTWSEKRVKALLDRYVRRDELLRDRIRRLDQNAAGTDVVKPDVKRVGGDAG